ncbi:MAG: glycosyl transferase [Clostridia bacterium]|nr:glycosyl transferase [Clostridia bacterium]
MNKIPKIIHYCWFGGKPLNKLGKKCLKSWKKYFPDYEIIEWNESNFDFNCCQYVKEAYEAKKWAFVSDYARYKILYEQGGLYFDTDVEVIKSFDDILEKGAFMGCENPDVKKGIATNPGLGVAVAPGLGFYKEILDDYEKSSFYNADGTLNLYTIVQRTTDLLKKHGLQDTMEIQTVADITIYPAEYFCPINMSTGELKITPNTHSIHRYAASWVDNYSKFRGKVYRMIYRCFGKKVATIMKRLFGRK